MCVASGGSRGVDKVVIRLSIRHGNKLPVQRYVEIDSQRDDQMDLTKPRVVGPKDGKSGLLGAMGVRFMIDGADSGGGFSLVEHPLPPRVLGAPLHRHSREDEYSYVLEGRIGALLGEDVVYGEVGDLIFKPRGQWHSFWNAGEAPARILEIISPAGFEKYFEEIVDMGGSTRAEPETLRELAARYGLEVRPESIPDLARRFGLVLPTRPAQD